MQSNTADSGLMKRGLFLLGLVGLLALVVLWVILSRPDPDLPAERPHVEWLAPLATAPAAGFPSALAWTSLPELSKALPSARGWEIRYNAAIALARRGSPQLPLNVMREMLDENQQMRNFRATLSDGRNVPDESAARRTVLQALKAMGEWLRQSREPGWAKAAAGPLDVDGLIKVYDAVEVLAHSSNLVVRTEAEKLYESWRERRP